MASPSAYRARSSAGNRLWDDISQQHVHLVGIGGIGLSAIARILLAWGAHVSGSDLHLSSVTDGLVGLGAKVFAGHRAENVNGATLLVMSSAIPSDNIEIVAAQERGIPVLKRADILGQMMEGKYSIAVAGTHGKTTTTAMIAHLLMEAKLAPSFIVGGILSNLDTNARAGSGKHFVIEADEYDHMFLGLRPRIAVVTHLEMDHPDCFPTMADMIEEFRRFLSLVPAEGYIVACVDEPHVRELIAEFADSSTPQVIRYGLSEDATWQAGNLQRNEQGGHDFSLLCNGEVKGRVRLLVPGKHNVKNALAALAVADLLGLDWGVAKGALASFQGTRRRFEVKGEIAGITVIDDYAHHPTQIRATLAAARERYPSRVIWAVFQPHTFSRTKALLGEFANAFGDADHVLVTDIYAARERDDLGVHAETLVKMMDHADVRYCSTLDQAVKELLQGIKAGDVLITLGAGDDYTVGERILESFRLPSG